MMRKQNDETASMRYRRVALKCAALMVLVFLAIPATTATANNQDANTLVIELFVRPDSEQCQHAEEFLKGLSNRREGMEVKIYDVTTDREALARLWKLSKQFGKEKAQLPTAYFCNSIKVGFRDAETTGREMENYLTVRAFVRPDCPHCSDAKAFLQEFTARWPAVKVEYLDVVQEANAREEVEKLTETFGKKIVSFPCLHVAGRLVVGFQSAETTGKQIEDFFRDRSVSNPQDGKNSDGGASKEESKSETQSRWLGPQDRYSSGSLVSANLPASRLATWPGNTVIEAGFLSGFGSLTSVKLPFGQAALDESGANSDRTTLSDEENKKKRMN